MNTLRNILSVALVGIAVSACGDLLDLDINEDPNAATEVEGDLLFPYVLASLASNRAVELNPPSNYWSQIWASNGSYRASTDRYSLDIFLTGNTWNTVYPTALKNLALMRDQALSADPLRPNVAAQAEIMMAYVFWYSTSLWGEVPYTQALQGDEFPQPEFDDQETILRGLATDLAEAVALIEPGGAPGVEEGDLVYGGDMEDWERFGNSLRLRTLMMIRNVDPSVDAEIESLLGQPLIRTNLQEAAIPFFDAPDNQNNLWKLTQGWFDGELDGQQLWYPSATLVDLMNDLGDPRRDTYFSFAAEDGEYLSNQYIGHVNGYYDFNDDSTSVMDQNIIRPDWPSRIVTASEVWFYEAEWKARQGDLGGAHSAYMQGVDLALDYFDNKPGAIPDGQKATYLGLLPQSFASMQEALQAIWGQQFIEVLDRSPENWVHWKRTKYPTLTLPYNNVLGDIIRRMSYPPDELSANPNAPQQPGLDEPMWFEN